MKKKILFLLLFVLIFPIVSFAKEDVDEVYIKSVTLNNKTDDVEETISYQGLSIASNIQFHNLHDYVEYSIIIQNDSDHNYVIKFDNSQFKNHYYSYELSSKESKMKAHSSQKLYLKISYDEELSTSDFTDGHFIDEENASFVLQEQVSIFENPKTFNTILYISIVVFIIILVSVGYLLHRKAYFVSLFIFLLCPFVIQAYQNLYLTLHVVIDVVQEEVIIPPEPSVVNPRFCVVDGYMMSSEKTYYEYEDGMTIDEWNESSYHTFDMTWNSFINLNGTYTNIERIGREILDSSDGCYYNGVIDIDVHPVFMVFDYVYGSTDFHENRSFFTQKDCTTTQTIGECFGNISDNQNLYYYSYVTGDCFVNSTKNANNYNLCRRKSSFYGSVSKNDLVGDYSYSYFSSIRNFSCLSGDTEVEVYDKKKKKRYKKKLRDVTYDDLVLAWDFDKGEFVWIEPFWIMNTMIASEYTLLTFSDGSILKVIGDHRIYNADKGEFTSVISSPIGMNTLNSRGEVISLVSRESITGMIDYCNIITKYHINIFANGILTSHGINNRYPIENYRFVKKERDSFVQDDFDMFDDDVYDALGIKELDPMYLGSKEKTRDSLISYIQSLFDTKK